MLTLEKKYVRRRSIFFIVCFFYIKIKICQLDIIKNKERIQKKACERYEFISEEEREKKVTI